MMFHSMVAETRPLPKRYSAVAYMYPVLATAETTIGHGHWDLYPVLNLFLPNMEVFSTQMFLEYLYTFRINIHYLLV